MLFHFYHSNVEESLQLFTYLEGGAIRLLCATKPSFSLVIFTVHNSYPSSAFSQRRLFCCGHLFRSRQFLKMSLKSNPPLNIWKKPSLIYGIDTFRNRIISLLKNILVIGQILQVHKETLA